MTPESEAAAKGDAAKSATPPGTPPSLPDAELSGPAKDRLLAHDYDGIQEYDNPLPGWWTFLFWACIFFSPLYAVYYHYGAGHTVREEYSADQAAYAEAEAERAAERIEEMGELTDANVAKLADDPAAMEAGRGHYRQICHTCHGPTGTGETPDGTKLAGVSLVDDEWIHGRQPTQIYATINNGVLEKGMPPKGGLTIGEGEVRKLAAFVHAGLPGLDE